MDSRVRPDALADPGDAEQVWWDVIEPAFDGLQTPYEPDARLEALTPGQRALYALHWMRSEVDNGGFHQYLYNPTGMLGGEALRGAELIGANDFAELLHELRSILPGREFVEDRERRIAWLESSSDELLARLDQLSDRFYDLMGDTSAPSAQSRLAVGCAAYVEANPEEFFLPRPSREPPAA